jgi:hypothetical protein
MALIVPGLNKAAGIVVRAALALIVNQCAIGKERAVVLVQGGKFAKRQVVNNHGSGVFRIVRAAAQVHDFDSRHRFLNSHSSGGIGIRAWQAAIPRTCAHGNRGSGIAADFARDLQRSAPADGAVNTIVGGGNRSLNHNNVFAFFFADHALQGSFSLFACAGHNGLVVFPGERLQND